MPNCLTANAVKSASTWSLVKKVPQTNAKRKQPQQTRLHEPPRPNNRDSFHLLTLTFRSNGRLQMILHSQNKKRCSPIQRRQIQMKANKGTLWHSLMIRLEWLTDQHVRARPSRASSFSPIIISEKTSRFLVCLLDSVFHIDILLASNFESSTGWEQSNDCRIH